MAQTMRRPAGEGRHIMLRTRQNAQSRFGHDPVPMLPAGEMLEIVRAHQPNKIDTRKKPMQARERRPGMARTDRPLDPCGQDAAAIGDAARARQTIGEGRHAARGLQRIAGRDHEPDLIEPEAPTGKARDMAVPVMRRIEGATEHADTHAPPIASARQRVGRHRHRSLRQSRTWPVPRS